MSRALGVDVRRSLIHLSSGRYYPNYLAFFHRLISQPPTAPSPYTGAKSSVVPVVEKYLLGGQGDMLVRCVLRYRICSFS